MPFESGERAVTGNPLLIGLINSASDPSNTTFLAAPSGGLGPLSRTLFWAYNTGGGVGGASYPAARIAVAGLTAGRDTTAQPKVGLWGETDDASNNGAGVVGRGGVLGVDPLTLTTGPSGVIGAAADNGNGVVGASNGPDGTGVAGVSDAGSGITGSSATGVSLAALGGGRLRQAVRPTAGAPAAGAFLAGEQVRDLNGELWLCVAGGSPGTWRRVASVYPGAAGGSMNFLPRPIRLYDSRSGAPLAGGANVDIQVTGTVVNGVSVPAGAVGVVGNVTVTQTIGPSGYLTLYPQNSPPSPATANVNWFAADQNLNTAAVVGLNPANGRLTIHNGIVGGSNPTHVIFDVSAFVL